MHSVAKTMRALAGRCAPSLPVASSPSPPETHKQRRDQWLPLFSPLESVVVSSPGIQLFSFFRASCKSTQAGNRVWE